MAELPRREEDVLAQSDTMIAGYADAPDAFPSADISGLKEAANRYLEARDRQVDAIAQAKTATEAKYALLDALRNLMIKQIEHSESDTEGHPERLALIGWHKGAKMEPKDMSSQFQALREECLEEDWDGYGAHSMKPNSLLFGERFLRALPTRSELPDVGVDPDGEVSMEWALSSRFTFSVSFGENDEISYAGLFGRNKVHGVEVFRRSVPHEILHSLERLHTLGNTESHGSTFGV